VEGLAQSPAKTNLMRFYSFVHNSTLKGFGEKSDVLNAPILQYLTVTAVEKSAELRNILNNENFKGNYHNHLVRRSEIVTTNRVSL
jgi:hypothetical protein